MMKILTVKMFRSKSWKTVRYSGGKIRTEFNTSDECLRELAISSEDTLRLSTDASRLSSRHTMTFRPQVSTHRRPIKSRRQLAEEAAAEAERILSQNQGS